MLTPLGMGRKKGGNSLLATGQTTQYAGYEDDGYYEKGTAKSYTVNTTGAQSGTTNITLNSKTDAHSNNTVLDNKTGLMWSRTLSASVGTASDGKIPWTTNGSGEGVFAFCAAANVASLGGYTDWRVPNIYELMSLVDYEQPTSLPDSTAFPAISGDVWSSTTRTTGTTNAMYVRFGTGGQATYAVKTGELYCMLVRGG